MAISYVGSISSLTTSVTTPAHLALDEMVATMVAAGATAPTNPAGGTNVWNSRSTANVAPAYRISDKLASGTNDTSDPLTGATNAAAISEVIYRGASGLGTIAVNTGTGTSVTLPAVTRSVTDGTSWVLYVAVHLAASGWTTVALPASVGGSTPARRDSQAAFAVFDSNGPCSSDPVSQSFGGTFSSNSWRAMGIEILASGGAASTQGLLALF